MAPLRALAWLALVAALAGCTDERGRPNVGPGCSGPGCGATLTSGGSNGAGGGGGEGGTGSGGAQPATLIGSVRVLNESTFTQSALFTGEATVSAPKAGGGVVSADYGASAGTSFTLEDVQAGEQWVLVHVGSAGAEVFDGYSLQHVPGVADVPVVDRAVLVDIASTITGQPALEAGAAHLALSIVDAMGQPREGIEVVDGTAGALILYDIGVAGEYTLDATATGKGGRILLLNATPPASGVLSVAVEDAMSTAFKLPVVLGPDAVTLAGFEL